MKEAIRIIRANEVNAILEKKEEDIIHIVSEAYTLHSKGESSLPHSIFLRFPKNQSDRIIGLPAYLNVDQGIAGIKWISSFPQNIQHGIERASAVMVLNNMTTGRIQTMLEASIISAKRTAASAALAARTLHGNKNETVVGMIGTGRINYEIFQFIKHVYPGLEEIYLYDIMKERATEFAKKIEFAGKVIIVDSVDEMFAKAKLVSFATTAGTPYISNISSITPDTTILHISLRDLAPAIIQSAYNIVDDVDHVCREKTSIHLTEEELGSRSFIHGTLADVIQGTVKPRDASKPVIFSPFGLGILDLNLGHYIEKIAYEKNYGVMIDNFFAY